MRPLGIAAPRTRGSPAPSPFSLALPRPAPRGLSHRDPHRVVAVAPSRPPSALRMDFSSGRHPSLLMAPDVPELLHGQPVGDRSGQRLQRTLLSATLGHCSPPHSRLSSTVFVFACSPPSRPLWPLAPRSIQSRRARATPRPHVLCSCDANHQNAGALIRLYMASSARPSSALRMDFSSKPSPVPL